LGDKLRERQHKMADAPPQKTLPIKINSPETSDRDHSSLGQKVMQNRKLELFTEQSQTSVMDDIKNKSLKEQSIAHSRPKKLIQESYTNSNDIVKEEEEEKEKSNHPQQESPGIFIAKKDEDQIKTKAKAPDGGILGMISKSIADNPFAHKTKPPTASASIFEDLSKVKRKIHEVQDIPERPSKMIKM
jgi:hypothetical protein